MQHKSPGEDEETKVKKKKNNSRIKIQTSSTNFQRTGLGSPIKKRIEKEKKEGSDFVWGILTCLQEAISKAHLHRHSSLPFFDQEPKE